MHLVRLIYCSESVGTLQLDTVHQILKTAQNRNPSIGVTGFLCFDTDYFLQALEGPATAVNEIYHSVSRDVRHKKLMLISYGDIPTRAFPLWAMGDVDLSKVRREVLHRFTDKPDFHPASMKAENALGLLIQLEELRRAAGESHAI